MDKYIINGGNLLSGSIEVKGAKNHAIKMLPAALLCDGPCELTNVPQILDIQTMSEMISQMGGQVKIDGNKVTIDPATINSPELKSEMVAKMRASFLFIIPLLHRFEKVTFPHPGGDVIGRRPIDMTLDFLEAMGANIKINPDNYQIDAKKLKGINYTFKWVSHTGTEAIVMAAVLAVGKTVIKNCALEPEVTALCDFLNSVGAKITGQGTPTITVEGVDKLSGGKCEIIPDRVEAGTFAIMGALCGKNLKITNLNPEHLDVFWKYFDLMNIKYSLDANSLTISKAEKINAQQVKTHEYPGFITDLQPPMTLLLTQAEGLSMMHETVYDGRLYYTDKLNEMGANIIMADPHRVIIQGPTQLYGKNISSPDIRAGITLVLGALIAQGQSEIGNIYHIERGYENLVERLQKIGANITQK